MIDVLNGAPYLRKVLNQPGIATAERLLQHRGPKLTVSKGNATAAEPVARHALGPEVVDFSNGKAAGIRAEYLTQNGRSASIISRDIYNTNH
jgi:hypothetical protein